MKARGPSHTITTNDKLVFRIWDTEAKKFYTQRKRQKKEFYQDPFLVEVHKRYKISTTEAVKYIYLTKGLGLKESLAFLNSLRY